MADITVSSSVHTFMQAANQAAMRSAAGVTSIATVSSGAGVETALAANTGSAGSFVVNGGALGAPSSGTLSSCSGLPISSGVSGLGTGVATFLATPSSANLASALTTKTGTGNNVFSDDPTFTTKIVSPIFKGSGTDVIVQDGSGNQAFRSIQANTWTDTSAGQYFQVGGSGVNVVFTSGSATNFNRLGYFANFFQISSGTRASAPVPVDRFEVVNDSNVKVIGVTNTGMVASSTGTTSKVARHGGKIKEFYTDAGNGTTVETDLYSYTTEASLLANNGENLEAIFSGVYVGSTSTKQLKVYFGGTAIFDSGALSVGSAASWRCEVNIIRVSSTVVRYSIALNTSGASTMVYTNVGELTGLTLSNTNILKITGTAAGVGAATNDIVGKLGIVNWMPVSV